MGIWSYEEIQTHKLAQDETVPLGGLWKDKANKAYVDKKHKEI